ncbi:hypothetical protein CDAR_263221 [Caerostris darwini]|uniref:Uncharacterized protein n=1 Tax=Caerostris darwini TaxID=1538125 RepID=A0AAV4RW19_9ARAC|nr:hypothetical protein CDAR_263221 [Caerostris darwini]
MWGSPVDPFLSGCFLYDCDRYYTAPYQVQQPVLIQSNKRSFKLTVLSAEERAKKVSAWRTARRVKKQTYLLLCQLKEMPPRHCVEEVAWSVFISEKMLLCLSSSFGGGVTLNRVVRP